MRLFAPTSLLTIAVAAVSATGSAWAQDVPAPASSPGSFRLPPSSTPTPTDVQGPVDPDAPILTRPKGPTPTPTPRPTAAPAPTPTPAPAPVERVVPPPRNSTLPPRFTPAAAPSAQESAAAAASADRVFPTDASSAPAPAVPAAPASNAAVPTTATGESGPSGWLYILAGLLAALAAGGGLAWWWRGRDSREVDVAPIEPPRIVPPAPVPDLAATPAPAAFAGSPLLIEARAVKLARSMMFATLSYELLVTNRSGQPLDDVRFGGDLVTAHARVPAEQQLADPALPLAPMQAISRLDPGESAQLTGELRLPVGEIRPIPHGKAVVYVPLLRVRAEAAGMEPVARTFVVGLLPGIGEKLQPFRLDEMPQTYLAVGQRALD